MDKNRQAESDLEGAVRMASAEAFVLEVLRDKEQNWANHPERWKLTYKDFLYQNGKLQCYELVFEWRRFLNKFQIPGTYSLKQHGLRAFFNGATKLAIYLRARLKEDNLIYDLEFIPHYRHIGKLHNDLSLSEALEIIKGHRL